MRTLAEEVAYCEEKGFHRNTIELSTLIVWLHAQTKAAKRPEVESQDTEDAARWRKHVEIVRMGGIPDALMMRLTMRENEKVWETQYVLDTAKFGRNTVLGLKAIGMAAEQKAEELFMAMGRAGGPNDEGKHGS